MKAVYEATYAVEELGIRRGDVVVVRPGHPEVPLLVVKEFDRDRLPVILNHVGRFNLCDGDPVATSEALETLTKSERRLALVR